MKKKAVALLLVMMMLFSVTGCTTAEIGYLTTMKEYCAMEGVGIDEIIVIDYDGSADELIGAKLGAQHLEVKLTGDMNQKELLMDIDMSYRLSAAGDFAPLGRMVMTENSVILSTEGIWDLVKTFGAKEGWSEEFIAEVDAYIADNPYISERIEYEGFAEEMVLNKNMMEQVGQLYDILINGHEGFEAGVVTAKDGGYELNLDKDSLVGLVDKWFDYAVNNSDKSYQFVSDFLDFAKNISGVTEDISVPKDEWVQGIKEVQTDWQALSEELKAAAVSENDQYTTFVKMTGDKGSRVYTGKEQLTIDEIGLKITADAAATEKAAVNIGANITKAVTAENFTAGLQNIIDKYTEFVSIVLTPEEFDMAQVEINGTFCDAPVTETTYAFVKSIGGSYAIDADELSDLFDCTVAVSEDRTKVNVSAGENQVAFDGFYDEESGIVYVKCRDLAQLGFNVVYEANPERITISK